MKTTVHVFAGTFASRSAATRYSQQRWSPESDDPTWAMLDDLDVEYLDSDFIETIHDADRWSYLRELLKDDAALTEVQRRAGDATTLVLVFEDALGGFAAAFSSTPVLTYCGRWAAQLA